MDAPLLEPTILDLHGDGSQELPIIRSPPHVVMYHKQLCIYDISFIFLLCITNVARKKRPFLADVIIDFDLLL